jgi:hypothetical protein
MIRSFIEALKSLRAALWENRFFGYLRPPDAELQANIEKSDFGMPSWKI